MNILITADLHLSTHPSVLAALAEAVARATPDAVIVAGDIGSPLRAAEHFAALRAAVGDRPIAVTLGNHDFWLFGPEYRYHRTLQSIQERYWETPAREAEIVLLDCENAEWDGLAVVGGYGHFDLGLAEPNLQIGGVPITREIYLSGGFGRLYWNDFRWIPHCGTRVQTEARAQARAIAARMDAAIGSGKRILAAVHTCPWRELNGHPLRGDENDILSAYSGNSLLGKEMEKRAAAIDFLACGHTHLPVAQRSIVGIPALNVGAHYGLFRGVLYDTKSRGVAWLGSAP